MYTGFYRTGDKVRWIARVVPETNRFPGTSRAHARADLQGLFRVKNLRERNADRRVVGIGFHDVRHVVPPLFDDRIFGKAVGGMAVGQLLHGEEDQRLPIEKNRVVGDAGLGQRPGKLGPDFVVAFLILGLEAGLEFHFECGTCHKGKGMRG